MSHPFSLLGPTVNLSCSKLCFCELGPRTWVQQQRVCFQNCPRSLLKTSDSPSLAGVNINLYKGFPGGSDGKESACSAGDTGSIPGSGRSPGEGNGNPFQYSCLLKSHGQRSLVDYSSWGCKESDMTKRPTLSYTFSYMRLLKLFNLLLLQFLHTRNEIRIILISYED